MRNHDSRETVFSEYTNTRTEDLAKESERNTEANPQPAVKYLV
jgi:hypothetical protein